MPNNALHAAFKGGAQAEPEQLRLIKENPSLLEEDDDSWEGWLPVHHASRWGSTGRAIRAALEAYPDGAKAASKGGYEPLHLSAMGGYIDVVEALIEVYPEGVLKADNNGRTPLDEAREGSNPAHEAIVAKLLAVPGVEEAEEAQRQLREARLAELMRPDGDDGDLADGPGVGPVVGTPSTAAAASDDDDDEEEESEYSGFIGPAARSLASRMLRAASNALWWHDGSADESTKEDLATFFVERAKYIPLRLELRERKLLRLLEGVLHVSDYTDKVESMGVGTKVTKRLQTARRELCSVLNGLLLACDYEAGQATMADKSYSDYAEFFTEMFEVARRYKVMNPERMRDTYGKLVYLLQDANAPQMQEELGFSVVVPLRTVYAKLEECDALDLLSDESIAVATQIVAADPSKSRSQIQRDIRAKEQAIEYLARRYRSRKLPEEELKQCLYSIGDNNAYLHQARDPADKFITFLEDEFPLDDPSDATSLAIVGGEGGARLTHSHQRQYAFVLQSLTLWRAIANDMFRLWCVAEEDLLREDNGYERRDTGQGLQRVQPAPRTSRAMHQLLHTTQTRLGAWVGSSLIHLGDSNVPNALMFIDKYSQVEHILNPILSTLNALDRLYKDAALAKWMDTTFGGVHALRVAILQDFFRGAFDGSGADNFFDAGSCIDGRLTSAWNWCSQLPSKPFYVVFKLAGFASFDGQFASG